MGAGHQGAGHQTRLALDGPRYFSTVDMRTLIRVTGSGQTRPWRHVRVESVLPPCVDGSELARTFFTYADWSVRPCVRPVARFT